jgi:hypothetical protein
MMAGRFQVAEYPMYFTSFVNTKDIMWLIFFDVKVRDLDFTPLRKCREIGFFDKESAQNIHLLPSVPPFLDIFDQNRHH